MKISSYALTIALITHKSTYATACGVNGIISTLTAGDTCTFDNFKDSLTAECSIGKSMAYEDIPILVKLPGYA